MHSGNFALAVATLVVAVPQIRSQVLSPPEIADPAMRALQEKHLPELKIAAVDIAAHQYPYRFYLSRRLDVSEKQELETDQRSIRFSQFQGRTVLQVTGNYFAAYSDQSVDRKQRFQHTYVDVMLPIVRAITPVLRNAPEVSALAIEVSHHVRKRVLGNGMERPENLVLVIPRQVAVQLTATEGAEDEIAILSQCSEFLDGEPYAPWGEPAPEKPVVANKLPEAQPAPPVMPARDTSAEALQKTQTSFQAILDRMARELDTQAHFIPYAPPALIAFRNASYLQLSITTTLAASDSGSPYRIAALAFDRHVSHLIRPTLAFFEDSRQFDGIVFSSTVRVPVSGSEAAVSESVEFFFPMSELRRYEKYDTTGQQLINAGFVLINGERVGLELQSAESGLRQ